MTKALIATQGTLLLNVFENHILPTDKICSVPSRGREQLHCERAQSRYRQ